MRRKLWPEDVSGGMRLPDEERAARMYMDLVAEVPIGISVLYARDPDDLRTWRIVEMNPAALRLTAATDADARRSLAEFAPGVEETELPRAIREVLKTGEERNVSDYASRRVPGASFALKVFSLGGRLVGLAFEDISARKAAQEALARSNADLAQFASMASHDLQAPLRKAAAFAELVRESLGGRLNAADGELLTRLLRSLEGMRELVDGLLSLARASTGDAARERVDLTRLAAEVRGDLEPALSRDRGVVEIGPLPGVEADPRLMRQLLRNLIGNAVKFRRPGVPPRVRVSGLTRPDGGREILVEDEGIGFDPREAGRLFQPFQRLHGPGEFPGHGMGLAICRRIVGRYGGTIAAESEIGRGTRIRVAFPAESEGCHGTDSQGPAHRGRSGLRSVDEPLHR